MVLKKMRKKINLVLLLVIFLFSINLVYSQLLPDDEPANIKGTFIVSNSSANSSYDINAFVNDVHYKTLPGDSSGNYYVTVGGNSGDNVTIKVSGVDISLNTSFESFSTKILNVNVSLATNGVLGCTSANICQGGYCVNSGFTTGVCSSTSYYCDSDSVCEIAYGETTTTCSADCVTVSPESGSSSSSSSSGSGFVLISNSTKIDEAVSLEETDIVESDVSLREKDTDILNVEEEANSQIKEEDEIPEQLFDITFTIDDFVITNIKDLSGVVTYTSFGSIPTPVAYTFLLYDELGNLVSSFNGDIVVETENIEVMNFGEFNDLELSDGKYTIVYKSVYNVDVTDEFEQIFTIETESKISFSLLGFLVAVILMIGVFFF